MAFHRCAIRQEDGSLVVDDVDVALEEVERDGIAEWYGTITVTQVTSLAAGQRYRLVLDDGRSGDFIVRRNTIAGGTSRAIAIHGAGPLQ
ncbi:MAG: hypothetical protein ACREMF_10430 [Gemmatimonadales bacterium]